jgi:hypothetical protein
LQAEVVKAYLRLLDYQEKEMRQYQRKSSAETTPSGPQASRGRDGASETTVRIVDAVGEALGVDTGTISEAQFDVAVNAAQKEML